MKCQISASRRKKLSGDSYRPFSYLPSHFRHGLIVLLTLIGVGLRRPRGPSRWGRHLLLSLGQTPRRHLFRRILLQCVARMLTFFFALLLQTKTPKMADALRGESASGSTAEMLTTVASQLFCFELALNSSNATLIRVKLQIMLRKADEK